MPYRYVTEKVDYSDYASGRVFYGAPGHPAFPIRLASEIFQACIWQREKKGVKTPCVLYDPVCGGAYHLAILACLHWSSIRTVLCSDINPDILRIAERNLSLLTLEGMVNRIDQLRNLITTHHKESHSIALGSAFKLRQKLVNNITKHSMQTAIYQADALDLKSLQSVLGETIVDVVLADVPYGIKSQWQYANLISNPIEQMLNCIFPFLSNAAIVAVAAGKQSKVWHPHFQRVDRFQIGRRRITLLTPVIHA